MEGKTEFFSTSHKRLLNIATWAKYLAWVGLVLGVLGMGTSVMQYWTSYQDAQAWKLEPQPAYSFMQVLATDPRFTVNLLMGMVKILFGGVFYFVVLRGISLGLNMIVETDVNYREKKEQAGAQ